MVASVAKGASQPTWSVATAAMVAMLSFATATWSVATAAMLSFAIETAWLSATVAILQLPYDRL
jgi:hypothetical protein